MTVIYMSDEPDHPGFAGRAKHAIGDKVKVVKITLTAGDAEETRQAFLAALGNTFEINEINLWETGKDDDPWHITYEIDVNEEDSIFLNNDEVETE